MLERVVLRVLLWTLGVLRLALGQSRASFALLTLAPLQPLLAAIGRMRAREVFLKARARCPAYREFLEHEGYRPQGPWRLADVPVTTKENYVKKYSIEDRCYGGRLAGSGMVIDESSGSSGVPNNWVRSLSERRDVRRILQLHYGLMYSDKQCLLLNCFALGPWATGMNVSMSLADVGILKSIGPDAQKLENTLRVFGPRYRYLVFGYPPFVKAFVDGTTLDLSGYHLDLVVGGEGISENLRAYLSLSFRSVVSSYGASDLEINLGIETEFTIRLRQRCGADPALAAALFGRENAPMIFQYNPLDYIVETLPGGEMVFTVCREDGASPKIRYDLKDVGGAMSYADLARKLGAHGASEESLARVRSHFPILYVFGRADLTVAFYGAKVYPSDLEAVVLGEPALARAVHSFQFASREDERADRRFVIDLELNPGASVALSANELAQVFYRGIAASNQDFREVTRMFRPEALEVRLHALGEGPFAGADPRIKARYIGASTGEAPPTSPAASDRRS